MVYLFGIMGFIGGFALGLGILHFFLRHKQRTELVEDKSLRIYGLVVWIVAALCAWGAVIMYGRYF